MPNIRRSGQSETERTVKEVLVYGLALILIAWMTVGGFAHDHQAIGSVPLVTTQGTVFAKAFANKTIVYRHRGITFIVFKQKGGLTVAEEIPTPRGIMRGERPPEPAEASLWHRYFGS